MARKRSPSRPHSYGLGIHLSSVFTVVVGAALSVIVGVGLSGVAQIFAWPNGRLGGFPLALVVSAAGVVGGAGATNLLVSWRTRQAEARIARARDMLDTLDELYQTDFTRRAGRATAAELSHTHDLVRQVETAMQSIIGPDAESLKRPLDYARVLHPLPTVFDGLALMFDFTGALTPVQLETLLPPDLATWLAMETSWHTVSNSLADAVHDALVEALPRAQPDRGEWPIRAGR